MSQLSRHWAAGVASMIVLATTVPAFAEGCPLLTDFSQAVRARQVDRAKSLEDQIKRDSACTAEDATRAVRERASLQVAMASVLPPGRDAEREGLLKDADEPDVYWGAAASIGELRFAQKRFAEAFPAFERALEDIKDATKTPDPPTPELITRIMGYSAASRQLAADEEGGKRGTYVPAAVNRRDGKLGGSMSPTLRTFVIKSVPLPINFNYGTDEFTGLGRQYAQELVLALQQQQPGEVIIVGHTDPRGSPAYNMDLSERRARAVERFLRSSGIAATIKTAGRGLNEPIAQELKEGLSPEQAWALDRRVEWRRP
jgi:OOP family OmpA-OmpF porin